MPSFVYSGELDRRSHSENQFPVEGTGHHAAPEDDDLPQHLRLLRRAT